MKILFLEDDPIIADIVKEHLLTKGYSIDYAFDINEAQTFIEHNRYDLFLFDVNVPDGNGFEFLESIRASNNNTPTIFITALKDVNDMKLGFTSGCDDYIKKPFELDELELRINNIKRLYKLDSLIKIDTNIFLDRENFTITIEGSTKLLREKEFLLLEYLAKNYTRTISHDELCSNVWTYENIPTDATIRSYIRTLRSIIGNEKIETIKGVGYRFIKS